MDNIKEILDLVLNSDLVVALSGILALVFGILRIFSKTSIGKKALNKLEDLHNNKNVIIDEAEKKLDDTKKTLENLVSEYERQSKEMKDYYEKRYHDLEVDYELLKELVVSGFSCINNKKIKELVEGADNEEGIDNEATKE